MQLIRPDLLRVVLRGVAQGDEVPFIASFVFVGGEFDLICIGQMATCWHQSLYGHIKDSISPQRVAVIETYDREIVTGALEWETPDEMIIKDVYGHDLPNEWESQVRRIIAEYSK